MATIPSNFNRLQPSSQPSGLDSGVVVTTVTPRRPAPSRQPADRPAILRSLEKEPEDAGLTGGTRSLNRRLLALNFAEPPARMEPASKRPAPCLGARLLPN
jgi:hypothetical protein